MLKETFHFFCFLNFQKLRTQIWSCNPNTNLIFALVNANNRALSCVRTKIWYCDDARLATLNTLNNFDWLFLVFLLPSCIVYLIVEWFTYLEHGIVVLMKRSQPSSLFFCHRTHVRRRSRDNEVGSLMRVESWKVWKKKLNNSQYLPEHSTLTKDIYCKSS